MKGRPSEPENGELKYRASKQGGNTLCMSSRLTAVALAAVMTFQAVPVSADNVSAVSATSSPSSSDPGTPEDSTALPADGSTDFSADSGASSSDSSTSGSTSASTESGSTSTSSGSGDGSSSADSSSAGGNAGSDASGNNAETDSGTSSDTAASSVGNGADTSGVDGSAAADNAGSAADVSSDAQNDGGTAQDVRNLPADNASEEAQEENSEKPEKTNEELMAQQHIVNVAPLEKNYRFYLADRNPAFALEDTVILQDKADDAAEAGTLKKDAVVFILEDHRDGWYYVESGTVRGFIRTGYLTDSAASGQIVQNYASQAEAASAETGTTVDPESYYTYARQSVPIRENAAYLHSLATVYDRVVAKEDSVVKNMPVTLTVHSSMSTKAEEIGRLGAGDIAYVLSSCGTWSYIESGDVRGFVKTRYLYTGDDAANLVEQAGGEESMPTAEETVAPEDNPAFYYTYTSTEEGNAGNPIRKAVLETAASCIGNPYVWGGTSLTNGCDCSGFVQTLFGLYGVSLPRTAAEQSASGTQIPVSEAEAGDLIFFAKDGYVYHVALCTGDNSTIEAYGTEEGIIANTIDTAHAVWAVRVLDN